jgi:hypothetical protein
MKTIRKNNLDFMGVIHAKLTAKMQPLKPWLRRRPQFLISNFCFPDFGFFRCPEFLGFWRFRFSKPCLWPGSDANSAHSMVMKKTIPRFSCRLLAAGLLVFSGQMFYSCGQNAVTNQTPTPEQQAAKVKDKWSKALDDARLDFQNSNDRESADFVTGILDSLDRPGGTSPSALESDLVRIKARVRELVRHGALESAASLNWAQWLVAYQPGPGENGPARPNHKTGGSTGPGGLVLYLPFDVPDDNGVIHDASGAGNDGRVVGATWVPDGKFGGAYHFSITNITDRIVIPNSDSLNPDYITISAWIKTADKDGFWNRIVDKDFRNAYCLDLGGDYKGKTGRGKLGLESSRGGVASDRVLDDNQWHFVAATYDGKTAHCYVDGVEKAHPVKNPGPLKKSTWDLCIGNSVVEYGTGEFLAFDGLIDEVRIYNRALSAGEIKLLATATQAGVDVVPAPAADNSGKPSAADRLKQLKSLLDQGLINQEDYDRKSKEIIDSL